MTAKVVLTAIHPVSDFEAYKEAVLAITRLPAPGVVRRTVYRSSDDPNEVMLELEFATVEDARAILPTFAVQDWLDRSGVEFYPAIFVGDEVAELGYDAG